MSDMSTLFVVKMKINYLVPVILSHLAVGLSI